MGIGKNTENQWNLMLTSLEDQWNSQNSSKTDKEKREL